MENSNRVWLITGSSRGFGRVWAETALNRGEKVVATARTITDLNDLVDKYGEQILPLQLDVKDREADFAAVNQAHQHFGRLDIVINNAGYGLFGTVEEVSEAEARNQLETNFFGALWVTQAAIPLMRQQGSGHIIQVSSIGGVAAFPMLGLYHASKWALEGFSEALSQEVAPFGIKVTIVEPGSYGTDWGGSSSVHSTPVEAYNGLREQMSARRSGSQSADPDKTANAMLDIVDAENPPLRVFFGKYMFEMAQQLYTARLNNWEQWKSVSESAS